MKIFFRDNESHISSLHHNVLEESLYSDFERLVPSKFEDVCLLTDKLKNAEFYPAKSILVEDSKSNKSITVGIIPDLSIQKGRVVLVCTRPLAEELEIFAKNYNPEKIFGKNWVVPLLRNYERVVFLDRFDYAESAGFSPWVKLELVDHYPVIFNGKNKASVSDKKEVSVVLLDHNSTSKESGIIKSLRDSGFRTELININNKMSVAAQSEAIKKADVHLHLNYSNQIRFKFSPYTSILNGYYTLLVPLQHKGTQMLDDKLRELCDNRSYSYVSKNEKESMRELTDFVSRVSIFKNEWSGLGNPEITRFVTANKSLHDTKRNMLLEVLNK